jgi:voltage-gated potassium channel
MNPMSKAQKKSPIETSRFGRPERGWREKFYAVIFESDTKAGRAFDIALIVIILLSIAAVMLESVQPIAARYGEWLRMLEWFFTIAFTLEYIARLSCVRHPLRYATSFFGIIDLLAILPSYLAIFFPGAHVLIDVRILRLLRMFRIFKLTSYVQEYGMLGRALYASRRKILVFLSFVMMMVVLLGTVMYVVEGPQNGFTSIPTAIYWAISTITTVGFGDITAKTDIGRFVASFIMILGWGILAVPTGIVTAEMSAQRGLGLLTSRRCKECLSEGHESSAKHCKDCGAKLLEEST